MAKRVNYSLDELRTQLNDKLDKRKKIKYMRREKYYETGDESIKTQGQEEIQLSKEIKTLRGTIHSRERTILSNKYKLAEMNNAEGKK
jgi:hypothetical protein